MWIYTMKTFRVSSDFKNRFLYIELQKTVCFWNLEKKVCENKDSVVASFFFFFFEKVFEMFYHVIYLIKPEYQISGTIDSLFHIFSSVTRFTYARLT